ncbi:MAG: hypothetical protein II936_05470 [Oscillospiraceae bacterium]|nr:hypothetical protein [Oscillospiraceae bacterium]
MNRKRRGKTAAVLFEVFIAVYMAVCGFMAVYEIIHLREDTEQIEAAAAVTTTAGADGAGNAQARANIKEMETAEDMDVPTGDTAFKSYMSYRAITNKESRQYKLQRMCWTDADGLRRYKTYYVVALGSYYADHIGERFRITTEDGGVIECVVGDFKADQHTDRLNQYTPMEGRKCVVEFVVDMTILDKTARRMGDISYIEGFSGNIEQIERIEDE